MFRKIIFGIFITLCLAGGIWWFLYTKKSRSPVSEGIRAIPQNAAIILESNEATNTWKKLAQTNIMWEELLGTQTFGRLNQQARFADSLIGLDPNVAPLLDDHALFISAHPVAPDRFDFLFVYSLPNLTYQPAVEQFLEKVNNGHAIASAMYEDEAIGSITVSTKSSFSYSIVNGTLLMSANRSLVEDAIRQLKTKASLATDHNFSRILNTAGKKVDATLYVNYKTFPQILSPFLFPTVQKELQGLGNFASCSGWDMTVKPNALMMSGFTYSNDSVKTNFLSIFSKQKAQSIELTKVIPAKTALMIFYGISNTSTFRTDYKTYLAARNASAASEVFTKNVNQRYNADIEESLFSWLDNELALVITEPATADYSDNVYAVMHTENKEAALKTLNALTAKADSVNEAKPDSSGFRGHTICHLNIDNLIPQLLGSSFSKLSHSYYTQLDDYIIFGNSTEALQHFISDHDNNHTLQNDKNYAAFAEELSAEANVYIYSAIARSTAFYSNFLTEQLAHDLGQRSELLHKFEAAAIQFSSNNKLFYSNVYLKYNPVYKQETGTLWELQLDSALSARPYLVINHNTKAKEILVQDDANKIYLISNTGKIIWTKQLHEKIMSDVLQVDVLKNNKLQMLFNTRSAIYMYDRNGNDMKGFPVKLRSPATNAITVVDYDDNRDYRIFIACDNKKILCYKANGEPVDGFKFDKTSNPVYLPIQYFSAINKDHLCAVDEKGKVYILDRKGDTRIRIKEQLPEGTRNFFIETGKDYSRSYVVAADTLGNVTRLSLSGDKEKLKMQDFETSPYFAYHDLNNDKTKEYIFLSRRELKVFNADKSLLFHYSFPENITHAPQFFVFPDGSCRIGVTSEATNELYLFNSNGSLYTAFPLKGRTAFSIGDMNNEGVFDLITGSAEHSIYVYQLQE